MNCVWPQKAWWFVNSGHRVFLVQWLPSWVVFIALTWSSQRVLVGAKKTLLFLEHMLLGQASATLPLSLEHVLSDLIKVKA